MIQGSKVQFMRLHNDLKICKQVTIRGIELLYVIIVSVILAALMELNKNILPGFILLVIVDIAFGILRRRVIVGNGRLILLTGYAAFTFCAILVFFMTRPPVKLVPAYNGSKPEYSSVVETDKGKVQGVYARNGKVEIFAGIPYAKPPVGKLRWKEPVEADPWKDVLKADHFAPMSMQPSNGNIYNSLAQIIGYHDYTVSLEDNYTPAMSEDSLYLNVWKPAGEGTKRPVIVYIHGGSLQTGQPWYDDYAGTTLAENGVVVVNMAYRLGVFGFHADEALKEESVNKTTGNYGLLDQIMALEWVKKNIEAFGGDPCNITLAGESAGSACVSALCTSPLAKDLFKRVIMESSTVSAPAPAHSFRLFDEAIETGKELYEKTGAKNIEELRRVSAEKIVSFAAEDHHITIDGYVLPETPYEAYKKGNHNEKAILMGYNKKESAPFALFSKIKKGNIRDKLVGVLPDGKEEYADKILALFDINTDEEVEKVYKDILSALWFSYGHHCLARQAKKAHETCYEYFFAEENGRLGSWHSGEEVYCYGNIPKASGLYDRNDRKLSAIMFTYWKNFAETGDPNRSVSGENTVVDIYGSLKQSGEENLELPVWAPVTDVKRVTRFETGSTGFVREIQDPFSKLYTIFDEMYGFGE